ncbi:hypothetical protein RRG08_008793 [Elysia crispata]|uniref:Uncharacterized protein n=1 Tax=Elysia crispata TaxID=231223 RepID=A0AAE1DBE2_9GAST|nr:hypothetical protein RRG08_008793 [Elysia crispata]
MSQQGENVSTDLVQLSTNALQAQERISWLLGRSGSLENPNVSEKVHACLDILRSQKAGFEKSDADFIVPHISEESLLELKQLTLMHTPASVNDEAKEKFRNLVELSLKDQCKSIESVTLLTCPWYELSQRERGEQAKHNILLVVFCSKDNQFFSPANPHIKENASVIDFGWFCAVELCHFGQALCRGRTRNLEAIYNRPGADVYSSLHWLKLRNNLKYMSVTGTPGFLEACLGQAVGGIAKKKKHGGMKLKEGASIFEICSSLRLLQHAENTLLHGVGHSEVNESALSSEGKTALAQLKVFYDQTDVVSCKQKLFDLLMKWAGELRPLANAFKAKLGKQKQNETDLVVGEWMMKTRLQNKTISPQKSLPDDISKLQELMQKVGGPVSSMKPEQIILVAVAGSAMYNLNTPTSDIDYVVVYSTPVDNLLSATKKLPECHESRGTEKTVEYGAYEARLLCEMLLKCSVVILELLFTEKHEYTSPLWEELAKHKQSFVTEKAISQYLGLIKNNFKNIGKGKHSESPKRDRKLFYQNFHKIYSIKSMMRGELPQVRVEGAIRDFIMAVRTQDSGEWSRDNILTKLEEEYSCLRENLCSRTSRLRENPDYNVCTDWLMNVRGL